MLALLLPAWAGSQILGWVLGSCNLLLSYLLTLGELPELEHAHKLRQGLREHNSALANEEWTWEVCISNKLGDEVLLVLKFPLTFCNSF